MENNRAIVTLTARAIAGSARAIAEAMPEADRHNLASLQALAEQKHTEYVQARFDVRHGVESILHVYAPYS